MIRNQTNNQKINERSGIKLETYLPSYYRITDMLGMTLDIQENERNKESNE